jgi:hypothetical protein
MASNFKTHSLNMALQAGKIKSVFPASAITYNQSSLTWKYMLTPTPLSNSYNIKLTYVMGGQPNVYVVSPTLALYPGATKLEHVYDTKKQWLCIYYRKAGEWKSSMLIADTIIPWTCEWLLHYECWLATGIWHGGGIHPVTETEKISQQLKRDDR